MSGGREQHGAQPGEGEEYEEFEIESVENIRVSAEGYPQYLVKWKGHWPGQQYSWLDREDMTGAKAPIEEYIRKNPDSAGAAAHRQRKRLPHKSPPSLVVDSISKPKTGIILAAAKGGEWFDATVENYVPGREAHLLVKVVAQVAAPVSLVEKSVQTNLDALHAALEKKTRERNDAEGRATHLQKLNDALANRLRTLLNYFKPPEWHFRDGKKEVGSASVEDLSGVDLKEFVQCFEQHPSIQKIFISSQAKKQTRKRGTDILSPTSNPSPAKIRAKKQAVVDDTIE